MGSNNVKEIVIPNGVKVIAQAAFIECKKLTTLYIPKSVTDIGSEAIRHINPTIYYEGTEEEWLAIPNNPLTSAVVHYNSTPSN